MYEEVGASAMIRTRILQIRVVERLVLRVVRGVSRLWYGSWTIGAAVAVLDSSGRLLLVENSYRAGYGLPGGFCRRSEEPEVAAMRELREETGLVVRAQRRSAVVHRDRRFPHMHFLYRVQLDVDDIAATAGPRLEVTQVGWFALSDLPTLHVGAIEQLDLLHLSAGG